jgi:polysaccharide export outer membrane protein
MKGFTKLAIFALLLSLTGCGSMWLAHPTPQNKVTDKTTAANAAAASDSYLIQQGDDLLISVWKEKDLQGEVMVRPDGGISFPLAGDITAAGKTTTQVQKDLAAKLQKYVPDPVVTVMVKQSTGNKIYVIGKVNRPGEYPTNRSVDVMQALAIAGGPTPYASLNKIKILRRENGELKSIPFKYSRVEKGEDLQQNIVLQGGDVVVVP